MYVFSKQFRMFLYFAIIRLKGINFYLILVKRLQAFRKDPRICLIPHKQVIQAPMMLKEGIRTVYQL